MFAERLKKLRKDKNITQEELSKILGLERSSVGKYESKQQVIPSVDVLSAIATYFNVSVDYLLGRDKITAEIESVPVHNFRVIGTIAAGFDTTDAQEDYTDDYAVVPISDLSGRSPDDYFVLRVQGDSMYPLILDGDWVLVRKTESVDSGSVAVVLYDGDTATVKRVNYVYGEDWLELIPQNPEFMKKRIEKSDLEQCRVLGRVMQIMRKI